MQYFFLLNVLEKKPFLMTKARELFFFASMRSDAYPFHRKISISLSIFCFLVCITAYFKSLTAFHD